MVAPLAIAAGVLAAGGVGYLVYDDQQKKKKLAAEPKPLVPASTGGIQSGGNVINFKTEPVPVPLGPSGLPAVTPAKPAAQLQIPSVDEILKAAPQQLQQLNLQNLMGASSQPPFAAGTDNNGNVIYAALPKPPPQEALMPGKQATVVTTGAPGNDSALRVRSAPSTTAACVPGGDSGQGGGFAKGQTVTITGPMKDGFAPVTGTGRQGNTLTGWSGAGFLK